MAIATDIALGSHDSELEQIAAAVRVRQKAIAGAKRFSLKKGDTVTFSNVIRPKYLVGLEAKVVKVNEKSIVVSCPDDPAYGRFQNLKNVRCPLTLIA